MTPAVQPEPRLSTIPPIWLYTDSTRLPNPIPAATRLPKGRAGIVFRHDAAPNRAAIGKDLAQIRRARRLILVVAGDSGLAAKLHAGVHLRAGRWPSQLRTRGFVTSSAHNAADLHRAAKAGADLVFLSPVFPTASHPGAPVLGPMRWAALARKSRIPVAPLGGIDAKTIRRLPRRYRNVMGAIGALR